MSWERVKMEDNHRIHTLLNHFGLKKMLLQRSLVIKMEQYFTIFIMDEMGFQQI